MTYEVELNGRVRTVAVTRDGDDPDRFRVTIDGTSHVVDCASLRGRRYSLLTLPDRSSHEIGIVAGAAAGEIVVSVGSASFVLTIDGRRRRVGRRGPIGQTGEQRVVAPMPGRVVRVLVQPGDEVGAEQGLVVVEAMKMENEIRAVRSGTVRDVSVEDGMSVEAGRVLVVVE